MGASERHINDIVKWFEMVCEGIRAEYEQGASHRDLTIDKTTLRDELCRFVE